MHVEGSFTPKTGYKNLHYLLSLRYPIERKVNILHSHDLKCYTSISILDTFPVKQSDNITYKFMALS